MKIYAVGGAIRDILMGFVPKDIDYVVVGSNHSEMVQQGFKQVGANFPVYLHPFTSEEYALARTEQKVGTGYSGFVCNTENISLYDDLSRRDLTINSLAVDIEDFETFKQSKDPSLVIDYFDGMDDINNKQLRHINVNFGLDPLRVLRVARFQARYSDFNIHNDTIELMKSIVDEIDDISSERIWIEVYKGLHERCYIKFFEALDKVNALNTRQLKPFNYCNKLQLNTDDLLVKFCLIANNFHKQDYINLRIPNDFGDISHLYNELRLMLVYYTELTPIQKLGIMTKMKVFNNTNVFDKIIRVLTTQYPNIDLRQLYQDLQTVISVDTNIIAQRYTNGQDIKQAIFNERLAKIS